MTQDLSPKYLLMYTAFLARELSAGKRSQDEEQANCLLSKRQKRKTHQIKGSKLGRETSPILKDPRLEPKRQRSINRVENAYRPADIIWVKLSGSYL